MPNRHILSGGRYPVLRSLALLYLISAGVVALGGVVAAVWVLLRSPNSAMDRLTLALATAAAVFFVVISMLAIAELLKLFMDIEYNSRMMRLSNGTSSLPGGPETISRSAGAHCMTEMDEETAEGALIRGH